MEASIREPNIKNFVRLLQCAAKFGDDLNIHANKDQWELAVTNVSKSAFCLFKLKKQYFCRYKALGETEVTKRRGVKCQLLVKSVLAVLGKSSASNTVERLDLTIVDPDHSLRAKKRKKSTSNGTPREEDEYDESDEAELGGIEARLIMKLVCKHGVTKKHSLHLGTTEFLRAEVDPNSTPSSFSISARALRDMTDHFSSVAGFNGGRDGSSSTRSENQLGWMFGKNEVRLKSWEGAHHALSTEIRVDVGEFDHYWVEVDRVDLTLPMKELGAALGLSDQLGIHLLVAFSEPTQPLTLTSDPEDRENDDFGIFCAIATTTCEAFVGVPTNSTTITSGTDRKPLRTPSVASIPPGSQAVPEVRDGPEQAEESGTRHSQAPIAKRKRSTLSMSGRPAPRTTSVVVSSAGIAVGQAAKEGLFLPHSQNESGAQAQRQDEGGNEEESMDLPRPTHVHMTSQQVMNMSGFGDMAAEDLMDALDDVEEEDELEQKGKSGRNSPQGNETEDGLMFNEDPEVFGDMGGLGGEDETGLGQEDKQEEEEEEEEEEEREEEEEMGEDENEFPATQAGAPRFETFFED